MDAADFHRRLGQLLRATRMAYGMSLADVRDRSGGRWKAATLRSWESGDRAVDPVVLAELAGFYGCPVVDLIPSDDLVTGGKRKARTGSRGEPRPRRARSGEQPVTQGRRQGASSCARPSPSPGPPSP